MIVVRLLIPCLLVVAAGCSRETDSGRHPDIFLITLDTVRADHCSAYGYARPTTPTLERLAREGVRCDVAYAPMPTTAPSHASMLTGLLPRSHGVLKNGHRLPESAATLPETLREAGYRTAAFVSSFVLDRRFGLEQGFDHYDDDFRGATSSMPALVWEGIPLPGGFDRRADETCGKALAWLRENGGLETTRSGEPPFFVWVHFFDPHSPYAPLPEYGAQFPAAGEGELDRLIAAYDAEIRFVDEQVKLLVDALSVAGRLDDTLVVVAADHGEGLMQHGHLEHGLHVYEEAVRVPLVLRWPTALPSGSVLSEPVQLVDLAPTILALSGAELRSPSPSAVDLSPFLRGGRHADLGRPVFLQRRFYESSRDDGATLRGEKHGIRAGRWKYIAAPAENTFELFDLETDPGELVNLYGERSGDEVETLGVLLERWLESPGSAPESPPVSEEDQRRLRSLGYVR